MTPKERNKAKSARRRYFAVSSAILIVLAGVLAGKYGLPFGSKLGNYQRQADTTHAQNKWAEPIELPGLPDYVRKLNFEEIKRNAELGILQTH